jgi:hypothetical protein
MTSIVNDGEWLPHSFDQSGSAITFVQVPLEQRRSLPFLGAHELGAGFNKRSIAVAQVQEELSDAKFVPVHFIFHTAFCGSTLLVNALNGLDGTIGLREPAILANLLSRRERSPDRSEDARLRMVVRLLSRSSPGTEAVVVKAPCVATPLLPHVLAAEPRSQALLLYGSLRDFLLFVAKRGARGRTWARQVYTSCLRNIPLRFRFSATEILEQTDLQIAGLGWLMRRYYFDSAASSFGATRSRLLAFDDLLKAPHAVLTSASEFLGLLTSPGAMRKVVAGPVFKTHSKENRPFDSAKRSDEIRQLREAHWEEVDLVARWVQAVVSFHQLPPLTGLCSPLTDVHTKG